MPAIHGKLIQLHGAGASKAAIQAAQILDALAHDPALQAHAAALILAAYGYQPGPHKGLAGVLSAVGK